MPSANAQVTQQQKTAATDSVRVSLLTCAAGGEIYSLFGHTATTALKTEYTATIFSTTIVPPARGTR